MLLPQTDKTRDNVFRRIENDNFCNRQVEERYILRTIFPLTTADLCVAVLLPEGLDVLLDLRDLLGEGGPQVGRIARVASLVHNQLLLPEQKVLR